MRNRIAGICVAAACGVVGALATETLGSECGKTYSGDGYSYSVSCVDLDELAKWTGAPVSGKFTQFLVTPSNQEAYGVAIVAVTADGKFLKAEPIYLQPDGLKKAMVIFNGLGVSVEHIQIISK